MKYTIVHRSTRRELITVVDYMMLNGWEPQGGVSVVSKPGMYTQELRFYQALTKKE